MCLPASPIAFLVRALNRVLYPFFDVIRPLSEAVENDHLEIVRLLLSYGADPSVATRRDRAIKSRTMVDFLAAVISDYDGGNSHSPWVFEGSSFFMGKLDLCYYSILCYLKSLIFLFFLHWLQMQKTWDSTRWIFRDS